MRSLKDNIYGVMDLGVVLTIGVAFAALMIVGFIIWKLRDQLLPGGTPAVTDTAAYNTTWASIQNVTNGFDDAVNLILVAITVFILVIAISALLMLRGR